MKAKSAVMVCVTGQRDCDRLIRAGRRMADGSECALHVLCVLPAVLCTRPCGEELEYLRQTAKDAGAEMTVYFQDNAPLVAASFARRIGAKHIFTGMAEAPVNGFVEDNDFTRKTVYTFCTSSSSGLGKSTQNLAEMAGGSGTWLDGQRFSSGASEATVTSWIESLNIL